MASRDKNKSKMSTRNDDVADIDFSVIRTAIQTGGKMVDQIINGIHYGSPEVRLLLQDECDIILECRVCRALFRGLPNFIAHKRVYCCQAYASHSSHSIVPLPSSSTVEEVVIVEPSEPGELHTSKVDRQTGNKGKSSKEIKKTGKPSADRTKSVTAATRAYRKNCEKTPRERSSQLSDVPEKDLSSSLSSSCQVISKSSEGAVNEGDIASSVEQGSDTSVSGKSPASILYNAAIAKVEREKAQQEVTALQLTQIPSNPNAVFVSHAENSETVIPALAVDGKETLTSESSSTCASYLTVEGLFPHARESLAKVDCAQPSDSAQEEPRKHTSETNHSSGTSDNVTTGRYFVEKTTLKNVTQVVRELRQKKVERIKDDQIILTQDAKSSTKIPPSFRQPTLPVSRSNASESVYGSLEEKANGEQLVSGSQLCFSTGKETNSIPMLSEGGSDGFYAKAVVKRCLTGQLGAVRTSPLKLDVDSSNDGYTSSSCSEDVDVHPLCRLRKREGKSRYESAMDLDNLRCRVCQMNFSRRRSLIYHCQTRHSGHRTIFPCPYCPGVFYYFWGLTRHLNTNHKKSHSEIDRMRKSLREKAYKQDVTTSKSATSPKKHVSKKSPITSSEDKITSGNEKANQRARPSLPAKKLVSAVKTVPDTMQSSVGGDVGAVESKSTSLPNTTTARVCRISQAADRSNKEESENIYRKVYNSVPRRRSPTFGNKITRHYNEHISSPAGKAYFVTTVKEQESTHMMAKVQEGSEKKERLETCKSVTSEVIEISAGATPSASVQSESAAGKEEYDQSHDREQHDKSTDKGHGKSADKGHDKSTDKKGHDIPDTNTVQSQTEQCLSELRSEEKVLVTNKKGQTSLVQPELLPSQKKKQGPEVDVLDFGTETCSRGGLPEMVDQSVPTKPEEQNPVPNLLHICPHCQRAFGRKISLLSHAKICRKVSSVASTDSRGTAQNETQVQTRNSKEGVSLRSTGNMYVKGNLTAQHSTLLIGGSKKKAETPCNTKERKESESRRSLEEKTSAGDKTAVVSQSLATPRVKASRNNSFVGVKPSQESENRRTLRGTSQSTIHQTVTQPYTHGMPSTESVSGNIELTLNSGSSQPYTPVGRKTSRPASTSLSNPRSSRESSVDSRNSDVRPDSARRMSRQTQEDGSSRTGSSRESSVESTSRYPGVGVRDETPRGRGRQVSHTDSSSKASSSRESSVESRAGNMSREYFKKDKNEKVSAPTSDLCNLSRTKTNNVENKQVLGDTKFTITLSENKTKQISFLEASSSPDLSLQSSTALNTGMQEMSSSSVVEEIPQNSASAASSSRNSLKPPPQTSPSMPQNKPLRPQGSAIKRPTGLDQNVESSSKHLWGEKDPSVNTPPVSIPKVMRAAHGKNIEGHLSPSNQQACLTGGRTLQRPQRKRRAPSRIADSLEYSSGKDSAKKANLKLEEGSCVSGLTTKTLEKSKGEADGQSFEEMESDEKTVRLVEEIWVDKKPGRPSERIRSNRIYVVEPARAGRLTCQDTRKVGQIVDEAGLYCMQCLQKFTSISNLRRHAIRHLGWRRFKCRLCRFCSYNRSECNTHILRSHPERLRSCNSNARVESFITDLNRQAASVRSNKKRRTLIVRQGEEVFQNAYARPKSRKKTPPIQVNKEREKETNSISKGFSKSTHESLYTPAGYSENLQKSSSCRDEQRRSRASATYFNISTRSSPRKFDTRPYNETDTMSHLYTRNKFYPKPTAATSTATHPGHSSGKETASGSQENDVNLATLDHLSLCKKPKDQCLDKKDPKTDSSGKNKSSSSNVKLIQESDEEDYLCEDKHTPLITLANIETSEQAMPHIALTEGIIIVDEDAGVLTEIVTTTDFPVVTGLALAERVPSPVQTFDIIAETPCDV